MKPHREAKLMRPALDVSSIEFETPVSPIPPPVSGATRSHHIEQTLDPCVEMPWREKLERGFKLKWAFRGLLLLALCVLLTGCVGFFMLATSPRQQRVLDAWQNDSSVDAPVVPTEPMQQKPQPHPVEEGRKPHPVEEDRKPRPVVATSEPYHSLRPTMDAQPIIPPNGPLKTAPQEHRPRHHITQAPSTTGNQINGNELVKDTNFDFDKQDSPRSQHFVSDTDTWGYLTREQALTRFPQDGWKYAYYVAKRDFPTYVDFMSQVGQEYMILNYLLPMDQYRYNGTFVDMASNDAVGDSNTYALEKYFGWTGICIEPNPAYWSRYVHSARTCMMVNAAVGQTRNQDFEFVFRQGLGGLMGDGFDNGPTVHQGDVHEGKRIPLQTVPLNEILDDMNMPSVITYLSLDVEGAESLILNDDFNFDKYTFWIITVERPKPDLEKRLKDHGYVYLRDCGYFGDRIYVHQTIPTFYQVISELGPKSTRYPKKFLNCKTLQAKGGITKSALYNISFDDVMSWKRFAIFVGTAASLIQEEDERLGKSLEQNRRNMNMADKLVLDILGDSKAGYLLDIDPIHNSVGEMLETQNGWKGVCIHNPDENNDFVEAHHRLSFSWRVVYRSCDLVLYDESLPPLDDLVDKFHVQDLRSRVNISKESNAQRPKIHLVTFGNDIKPGTYSLILKYSIDMILIRSSAVKSVELTDNLPTYDNILDFCRATDTEVPKTKFPTDAGGRAVLLVRKSYAKEFNITVKARPALCLQEFWRF